jgi:hypothetical protein
MPIQENASDAIVSGGTAVALSSFFSVSSGSDPAYLVVDALDRNEYTAAATDATGDFSANGKTLALSSIGQDGRGAGIVYTYQASTGTYVNATYGTLTQLDFAASASVNDVTNISLFGASNLGLADAYANNAYALMQADEAGYIGSATLVTRAGAAAQPAIATAENATPDKIAAIAQTFVGDAWNMDGCWVLASTIAAEAGASLPVQSTSVGTPGAANGEWKVLYDGSAGANANWSSLVSAGDVIAFVTAYGGGHITTCVSGSGASAQLIDNITYENGNGSIANPANDGSSSDILVEAAHPASQEFSGVNPQDVVVYALDTPVVAALAAAAGALPASAVPGTPLALSSLVKATDPFNTSVTSYQVYDSLSGATIGSAAAHSAATAVTAASLSSLTLNYTSGGTDTVEVRAFNGTYWGDWQSVSVSVATPAPAAPKLTAQTSAQSWAQGAKISLVLSATTFTDPQKETLTYSAAGANGAALPSWLTFNATTRTFAGTVPTGSIGSLPIVVTARDSSGLSTSETFTATIPALAPTVAAQTAGQTWVEGSQVAFKLATGTFADPQHEALTLKATLASGAALPGWLSFNAATGTFSGTAPGTPQSLSLKVTATDTSGLSASDIFTASIPAVAPTVAVPTGNVTWAEGAKVSDTLPAGTFADPQHEALTLKATLASGAALPSWLSFNASTDTFSGTAPSTAGTLSLKVSATDTSNLSVYEIFTATIGAGATGISLSTGFEPPALVPVREAPTYGARLAEAPWHGLEVVLTHH